MKIGRPLLYAPQRWEWGGIDATFSTDPPADELVTNVHVAGFAGDRVVVCRDEHDRWFLPGGTREPGESIDECAARELAEEAGARLTGPLRWIGAHHCVSDRPRPYRPHQPHPEKAWLWCVAEVEIVGEPTNPDDGEQVEEVHLAGLAEAQALLGGQTDWMPDLLALAVELRGRTPGLPSAADLP